MLQRHAAAAIAARLVLVALQAGPYLLWRPEVTTPANSLLQIREGVRLMQLGVSPYKGASCHAPPLMLTLLAPFAAHETLYALPNIVFDCMAALLVARLARQLYSRQHRKQQHQESGEAHDLQLPPRQLAILYLWNPFAIMACVSGSTSTPETLAVLLAVYGAVTGSAPLAAFGVAVGGYLSLHPLLLLLPLGLMLLQGPEDTTTFISSTGSTSTAAGSMQQPCNGQATGSAAAVAAATAIAATAAAAAAAEQAATGSTSALAGEQQRSDTNGTAPTAHGKQGTGLHRRTGAQLNVTGNNSQLEGVSPAAATLQPSPACRQSRWRCIAFLCYFGAWSLALLLLSDLSMRAFPEDQGTRRLGAALSSSFVSSSSSSSSSGGSAGPAAGALRSSRRGSGWLGNVYGLLLSVEDYQPNIGLFWYFFTEMFDGFRAFFRFVFHSSAVVMAVPLALRFPSRPLFLVFVQLLITSLFKPYPSVGDLVPWMALLPLLQQQLVHLRLALFLSNSFLLLVVLGPAMWYQWILVDAANSNFFYSITLLFGAWQVLFVVQMLLLTIRLERLAAGDGAERGSATSRLQPAEIAGPNRLKAE